MIGRLRQWFAALRPIRLQRVACGHSRIAFNPRHEIYLRAYYRYCVAEFCAVLAQSPARLDLIFGDYACAFDGAGPGVRVDLQFEHTLVKPGGRDSADAVVGRVPIAAHDGHYLVRVARRSYLESLDLVIEYSAANVENLRSSGQFDALLRKTVLIAPCLHATTFGSARERGALITMFADTTQPRRAHALAALAAAELPVRNVKRRYEVVDLQRVYAKTRILINVHQTDHHDTLEELRVLPALLNGVIVVSEDVPLKSQIAYSEFIIWTAYDDLAETVRAVQRDYAAQWQRIFGDGRLAAVIDRLREQNRAQVTAAVEMLQDQGEGSSPISRIR